MITLVTTSTGRPLCFSLLEKWIARQSLAFDQWIVVGEDLSGYTFHFDQQVIQRKTRSTNKSICANWLAALPAIRGDKILVIEDDDFYHPDYIKTMSRLLDKNQLAGLSFDLYFKLDIRKYIRMGNSQHASLACTAFRDDVIPQVERCARVHKSVFIDCYLWSEGTQNNKYKWQLTPNRASDGKALHVGMKRMPGKKGLGIGHNDKGCPDPQFQQLINWIGNDDVRVYRDIPRTAWDEFKV